MSFRLNTLILAAAAVLTPLAVSAQGIPTHDGFQLIGDTLVRVEQPGAVGKTRAEVLAELAAWRKNPVHADGWAQVNGGDSLRFVGHTGHTGHTGPGRSRAEVLAELEAWRKNPVHADGWAEVGGGDSLRYVGVFKPAAAPTATSNDLRLAAGEGFSMGEKAEKAEKPTASGAATQAEPKVNLNDLPVHLRFGRH